MIDGCTMLGIYPDAINRAYEMAIDQLGEFNLNDIVFNEWVEEELEDSLDPDNVTNSIIFAIFRTLEFYLEDKAGIDADKIDYFVNGSDSHFYIDKEEVR